MMDILSVSAKNYASIQFVMRKKDLIKLASITRTINYFWYDEMRPSNI